MNDTEQAVFRVGEERVLPLCEDGESDGCDGVEGGVFVLYARGALRCLSASGAVAESCVIDSGQARIRAVDTGVGTLRLQRADDVGGAEARATVMVHPFWVRWAAALDPLANQVRVELITSLSPRGTITVSGSGLDDGRQLALGEPAVLEGADDDGAARSVTAFVVPRGSLPRQVTVRWEESMTVCSGLSVEDPAAPVDAGLDADGGALGRLRAEVRHVETRMADGGISGSGILALSTATGDRLVGITPTLVPLTPGSMVMLEGEPTDVRGEVPFRFTARELPFDIVVRLSRSGDSAEVTVTGDTPPVGG